MNTQDGSQKHPFTDQQNNMPTLSGKFCKCSSCNKIDRCTPRTDFYSVAWSDKLVCWECLAGALTGKRIPIIDQTQ